MATILKYFKDAPRRATRNTPPTEVQITSDPQSPVQLGRQTENTPSLENLFVEISKMSNTLHGGAADITTIKETTNELKNTVNGIQEKLEEAEGRFPTWRTRPTGL